MPGTKALKASKVRGSGFEEFFADSPLTPAEAEEEREDIYSPNLSLEERLQNCIQRFRARRRLNNELALYFNEYLFLGGVDTNPYSFASRDAKTLKDMDLTPAEKREITATDVIYTSPMTAGEKFYGGEREAEVDGKKVTTWSVDFTAVVSGFLSNSVAQLTGLDEERLEQCIGVVENFLKYVLQHDVCPEYADDINSAIQVCGKAREEWPMILRLEAALPGQFNLAAAQVFGFHDQGNWALVPEFQSQKEARTVFSGIFDESSINLDEGSLSDRITKEMDRQLELISINAHPSEGMRRLVFKPTVIEDGWDQPTVVIGVEEVCLCLEAYVVEHMKVGMKVSVTLVELDFGLTILKSLKEIVPSFHVFLPQALMEGWKAPRPVQKPPPSVHDAVVQV